MSPPPAVPPDAPRRDPNRAANQAPRRARDPVLTGASDRLLARLRKLHPSLIDLSLGRIERLLDALERPQDRLPDVIHVAGTNGKGSVIAFMKAMLEAAGLEVHVFTSPHLVRFHERIRLASTSASPGEENGAGRPRGAMLISEAALIDVLGRAEAANAGAPITFFEITTAAAFLAFAENPADVLLLETGLGGRLDATNVIARPRLTVITPISIDHTHFLGDRLKDIAGEKAGIMKPSVPCILSHQDGAAMEVLEARAGAIGAPLVRAGMEWDAFEQHGRLVYQSPSALHDLPLPALPGRHQIDNAGTAIAGVLALTRGCDRHHLSSGLISGLEHALERGLREARWPARLQNLAATALGRHLGEGCELWLDGGHNPAAGRAIANAMAELEERAPKPLHLVTGMMGNKDARAFLAAFRGLAEQVFTVPVPGSPRAFAPEPLAELARASGLAAAPAAGIAEALAESSARASGPVRVLICGSLYLAGHVLKRHLPSAS